MLRLSITAALCAVPVLLADQSRRQFDPKPQAKVLPVDEAIGHPDILDVRARLIKAAKRRDLEIILSFTEPSVRVGCKDSGRAALKKLFEREEPNIWSEFYKSLTLGGMFVDGTFHTNYVVQLYAGQPGETIDGRSYEVVTGANIPVYDRPAFHGKQVSQLSYEVVLVTNSSDRTDWTQVEFAPSKLGFVRSSSIEAPTGISVMISQKPGGWRIIGLDWACE